MTIFTLIKVTHVLLAIVAIGFNATYGIWLARAAREPSHRMFVLNGIKILDDRVANPAYVLLIVTGLLMVAIAEIPLQTFWVAASLVLYAALVILGLGVYSPTLRRQIAMLEPSEPTSEAYHRLERRGAVAGGALAVLSILIVTLMVTKPTL